MVMENSFVNDRKGTVTAEELFKRSQTTIDIRGRQYSVFNTSSRNPKLLDSNADIANQQKVKNPLTKSLHSPNSPNEEEAPAFGIASDDRVVQIEVEDEDGSKTIEDDYD
mmetsp:Transcript_26217/g.30638  ORF Transcript_26217/g.30638 Transcript_26217/m.30638 type:complete len:110 (+) Transcript_26217:1764-2093(+)